MIVSAWRTNNNLRLAKRQEMHLSRHLPRAAVRIVSTKLPVENKYLRKEGRAVGICHVRAIFLETLESERR